MRVRVGEGPVRAATASSSSRVPLLLRTWALLAAVSGMPGPLAADPSPDPQQQALIAERDDAIAEVQRIVNQPVVPLERDPSVEVVTFRPGWFHEGAKKPAFATVDVRRTQQFPYDRHEFVTSDLNPGLMFRGRDLEFNSMTKHFYKDRSLPKKRLTEEEMLEINRLYRIIGRADQERADRTPPAPRTPPVPPSSSPTAYVVAAGLAVLLIGALYLRGRSG